VIRAEDWAPADGLILEPNAFRAATETQQCLALTAGPGAGKTEMLAQRADFLLRTGVCRYPNRILAISFKTDASRNLKDRVYRRCGSSLATRFDSYTFHAFAKRIIDRFRPILIGQDALDIGYTIGNKKIAYKQIQFPDLIPLAIHILKASPIARNAIRMTYCDVFLDEFQDCTDQQYELIKLAFLGTSIRLTAVGDTKQRIMGWANALEGVFSIFASDFKAISLNMYRNFRSAPRLLRMQNEIIRKLDPASAMLDEQIVGNEGEIGVYHFDTSQSEADKIADHISGWINDGIPHAEIAILISKQLDLYADRIMVALAERGIPFRNEQQLQDISGEPAARLVVDYLLSLLGSREPGAWVRLTNQLSLFDHEEQSGFRQNWQKFMRLEQSGVMTLQAADRKLEVVWSSVERFLAQIGFGNLAALAQDYAFEERLQEIIQETKSRIEALLVVEKDLVKALAKFSDDCAVRILTIHKSKGLEFDSVVMSAIEREIFWGNEDENRCAFFVGFHAQSGACYLRM
jgi:superfamily I DNA/RNA helicase